MSARPLALVTVALVPFMLAWLVPTSAPPTIVAGLVTIVWAGLIGTIEHDVSVAWSGAALALVLAAITALSLVELVTRPPWGLVAPVLTGVLMVLLAVLAWQSAWRARSWTGVFTRGVAYGLTPFGVFLVLLGLYRGS